MVFSEMLFQAVIIDVVLLLPPTISPITEVASLMLVSAVNVELIVAIEPLSTKAAFRMTFETALVDSPRIIIAKLFVLFQLGYCEQLMFMSEDLLVSRTQIAHDLMMGTFDVAVEIRPPITCHVAAGIWAIVAE